MNIEPGKPYTVTVQTTVNALEGDTRGDIVMSAMDKISLHGCAEVVSVDVGEPGDDEY